MLDEEAKVANWLQEVLFGCDDLYASRGITVISVQSVDSRYEGKELSVHIGEMGMFRITITKEDTNASKG